MELYQKILGGWRSYFIHICLFCFILLSCGAYFHLQVVNGDKFRILAENNRVKLIPSPGLRGYVYDVNGHVLVDNRPLVLLQALPDVLIRYPQSINEISQYLSLDVKSLWKKLRESSLFFPVDIHQKTSLEDVHFFHENKIKWPGFFVNHQVSRFYTLDQAFAHLSGYIGALSKKEYSCFREEGYYIWDKIGKMGLEKSQEAYLRGNSGGTQVEIMASGLIRSVLGKKSPERGVDLTLSIHSHIQKIAYEALEGYKGAVIVSHPQTGDIIAMVSQPSFSPSLFVNGDKRVKDILNDSDHPLMNRAISMRHPPGSLFKIIVGLIALDQGWVTPHTQIDCRGSVDVGHVFHCWNKKGHGLQSLSDAIKNSCNVYFYEIAQRSSIRKMLSYCRQLGLNKKTKIALPFEVSPLLPTPSWKKRRFKDNWYLGDTFNFSIGQGFLLVSPLQITMALNACLNGGRLYKPRLILKYSGKNGETIEPRSQLICDLHWSPKYVNVIKKGMRGAIQSRTGTAHKCYLDGYVLMGKTGTAQVASEKVRKRHGHPQHLNNHAWFYSAWPYDEPVIAVTVFLQNGHSGGHYAAPVAKKVWKAIFSLRDKKIFKTVET